MHWRVKGWRLWDVRLLEHLLRCRTARGGGTGWRPVRACGVGARYPSHDCTVCSRRWVTAGVRMRTITSVTPFLASRAALRGESIGASTRPTSMRRATPARKRRPHRPHARETSNRSQVTHLSGRATRPERLHTLHRRPYVRVAGFARRSSRRHYFCYEAWTSDQGTSASTPATTRASWAPAGTGPRASSTNPSIMPSPSVRLMRACDAMRGLHDAATLQGHLSKGTGPRALAQKPARPQGSPRLVPALTCMAHETQSEVCTSARASLMWYVDASAVECWPMGQLLGTASRVPAQQRC